MENDICLCTRKRSDHRLQNVPDDGVPFCLNFQLDRKATWAAEKGKKPKRMAMLYSGCVTCKMSTVTLSKRPDGSLFHANCPVRQENTHAGLKSASFKMPVSR